MTYFSSAASDLLVLFPLYETIKKDKVYPFLSPKGFYRTQPQSSFRKEPSQIYHQIIDLQLYTKSYFYVFM